MDERDEAMIDSIWKAIQSIYKIKINTETFSEYVKRNSGAITDLLAQEIKRHKPRRANQLLAKIEFHEWFEKLEQWVENKLREK